MSTFDLEKDHLKKAPSISIHVYKPGTLSFWKWLFNRKSKQGPLPVSKNYKFKLNAEDLNAMRIKGFDLEKLKMSVANNEPHKNNQHKKNMFIIPKEQLGLKENELLSDFIGSNIKRKTKHITKTTKIYKKSVSISTISISSKGSVVKESLEHIHHVKSKKSLPRISSKPSFCVGLKHKTTAKRLINKGILSKSIPASVIEHNMQKKLFIPLHLGDRNTHKIISLERKGQGDINTSSLNSQTPENKIEMADEHSIKMKPAEGQVPERLHSIQEQDGTRENPAIDGDVVPEEKQLKQSPAIHCLVSEKKINKETAKKYIVSYKVSQTKNTKKRRKLKRNPLNKTSFTITTIQNGKFNNNLKNKSFVYPVPDLNDKTIGQTQGQSGDDKIQCDNDNNINKSLILKNNKAHNNKVEESQNNLILELISMFNATLEKDKATKQNVQNSQNLPLMVLSKPTFNWRHKSLISASESQYESEEVEQSLKLNKNENNSTVDGQTNANSCDRKSSTNEGLKEERDFQNAPNKSDLNTIHYHPLPSESGEKLTTLTNSPITDTKDPKKNICCSGSPVYNNLKKNHVRLGHSISLPANLLNEADIPSKPKEDTEIITVTITVDNSSTDKVNIQNNMATPPIQFKLVHNKMQRKLFLTSSENPGDLAMDMNLINGTNLACNNDESKTIFKNSEIPHITVNNGQTFINQTMQEGNKRDEIVLENVPFLQAKRCISLTDHTTSINEGYLMNQNVSDHSTSNNFNQKKLFLSKRNNSVIQEHGLICECEPIYLDQKKRKEFEEKLLSAKRQNLENETGIKGQLDKFGKGCLSLHSQTSPGSLAGKNIMKINKAKEYLISDPEEYLIKRPELPSQNDYFIKVNLSTEKANSTSIQSSNQVNKNLKPNISTTQLESHSVNMKNKFSNSQMYSDKQPFCVIKKDGTSTKSVTNKLDGHKRSLRYGLTLHQTITEESEDEEKSVGDHSEQGDSPIAQDDRLDHECKTEESEIKQKDLTWILKDDNKNHVIASNFSSLLQPSMSIMQLSGSITQSSKKAVSTSSQTDASMFSLLMSMDMLCEQCGRNKGPSDYDCQPNTTKNKNIVTFLKENNNNQTHSSQPMVNVYQEPLQQSKITINAKEGLNIFTDPQSGDNNSNKCANGTAAQEKEMHYCSNTCLPTFSDSDSNSTDLSDQNDESLVDNNIIALTESFNNNTVDNNIISNTKCTKYV